VPNKRGGKAQKKRKVRAKKDVAASKGGRLLREDGGVYKKPGGGKARGKGAIEPQKKEIRKGRGTTLAFRGACKTAQRP